jgi:hypothetical protein
MRNELMKVMMKHIMMLNMLSFTMIEILSINNMKKAIMNDLIPVTKDFFCSYIIFLP